MRCAVHGSNPCTKVDAAAVVWNDVTWSLMQFETRNFTEKSLVKRPRMEPLAKEHSSPWFPRSVHLSSCFVSPWLGCHFPPECSCSGGPRFHWSGQIWWRWEPCRPWLLLLMNGWSEVFFLWSDGLELSQIWDSPLRSNPAPSAVLTSRTPFILGPVQTRPNHLDVITKGVCCAIQRSISEKPRVWVKLEPMFLRLWSFFSIN